MSNSPSRRTPAAVADAWLLDHFRRAGHPAAQKLQARRSGDTAWSALLEAGVPESEVAAAVVTVSGVPRATEEQLAAADPALLPRAVAVRHQVVPVASERGGITLATANPMDAALDEEIRFVLRCHVSAVVATPRQVAEVLARIYPEPKEAPAPAPRVEAPVSKMNAVDWQDRILRDALEVGASDVHVEPQADGSLVVRFRVDGALYDALHVPGEVAVSVVSRFKVTAGLDIADRIRPQDGRSSVRAGERTVDLRISTLPLGDRGEKVVIRVLDARAAEAGLEGLGFLPAELYRFRKLLDQREGMVLVTGPTGSGKTTTLYSALSYAKSPESNVVTVEDPIEYRLDGVNQVQVNEKAGMTFANVLRSMLRQDPDVILVGEIRDPETAAVALKASMTGHLVLSTLHTNDAPSAVHRLLDLGADPAVLASSLKGVVAQRLVRRLCEDCCQPVSLSELPPEQQMLLMGKQTDRLRRAVGCEKCRGTGFRGRMVVPEVLLVTPEVGRAITRGSGAEIAELAGKGGMLTLWEAGVERVLAGCTSMHELIDNIAAPMDSAPAAQAEVDALVAALLAGKTPVAAVAEAKGAAPAAPSNGQAEVDSLVASLLAGKAPDPAPAAVLPLVAPRPASRAGDGPRVLVVDEDREERRTLRALLEGEGFRVLEAADGEAALSYATRLRPDAVVTDLVMPRLDGIGLLQALGGGVIPVLVYTAQTDQDFLAWAAELGARQVLSKTADRPFVGMRLRTVLSEADAAPLAAAR